MNSKTFVTTSAEGREEGTTTGMFSEMRNIVGNLWWLFVILGIVSILFGVTTLFMPDLTLAMLITLFTLYLMTHGLIELVYGFSTIGKDTPWVASVLFGAALIGVSVYLMVHPEINVMMFVAMIGAVLIARGINAIIGGTLVPTNRVLWIISGILSIVAGIVIWIYPGSGSLAFAWVLGLYALIDGTLIVSTALSLRSSYKAFASQVKNLTTHSQSA